MESVFTQVIVITAAIERTHLTAIFARISLVLITATLIRSIGLIIRTLRLNEKP
jgi:hypothetical protein